MMATKLTVWILRLLHLLITLQKVLCAFVINKYMRWSGGFNRCHLANKEDVDSHIEYYRAMVEALSVHTPWMVHEGQYIPENPAHNKTCSVLVVANNTFYLEAEECWKSHNVVCETKNNGFSAKESYNTAKRKCQLSSYLEPDVISKFQLTDGTYWTDIHRIERIRWFEKKTLQDLCNEFGSLDDLKCILVDNKSGQRILKLPTSCMDWHPLLCSRKRPETTQEQPNNTMAVCNKKTETTTYRTTMQSMPISTTVQATNTTTQPPFNHANTDEKTSFTTTLTEHQTRSMYWSKGTTTNMEIQTTNEQSTTNVSSTTLEDKTGGNYSFHWLIVSGVISLSSFFVGMTVISLLIALYKKRKTYSSAISQDNQYIDLQRMDYDHLQTLATPHITLHAESHEVEGHYLEIT